MGAGKRKRGINKPKDDRLTKGIGKYFANKNGQTAAKPKVRLPQISPCS
jgi:hypothetical protein